MYAGMDDSVNIPAGTETSKACASSEHQSILNWDHQLRESWGLTTHNTQGCRGEVTAPVSSRSLEHSQLCLSTPRLPASLTAPVMYTQPPRKLQKMS